MRHKIGVFEKVRLHTEESKTVEVRVKIDTGAKSTSLDKALAKKLGLLNEDNLIQSKKKFKSALGQMTRPVIHVKFELGGVLIETDASLADRSHLRYDMIIGRKDLEKFVVEYDSNQEPLPS